MFWKKSIKLIAAVLIAFTSVSPVAHAIDPWLGPDFKLEESDLALLKAAAEILYMTDDAEIGAAEAWNNPETGNHGTVKLIRKHEYKGMPCRELQHDIELKRSANPHRFTLDRCRTDDGEWKILAR